MGTSTYILTGQVAQATAGPAVVLCFVIASLAAGLSGGCIVYSVNRGVRRESVGEVEGENWGLFCCCCLVLVIMAPSLFLRSAFFSDCLLVCLPGCLSLLSLSY